MNLYQNDPHPGHMDHPYQIMSWSINSKHMGRHVHGLSEVTMVSGESLKHPESKIRVILKL